MPFTRRTKRTTTRRRTTRKRTIRKRPIKTSVARRIVAAGAETKKLTLSWFDTMDTNTATSHMSVVKYFYPLALVEGSQRNERTGIQVYGKYLELDLAIMPTTLQTDCFALRVYFIRLKPTLSPLIYNDTVLANNFSNMYLTNAYNNAYPDTTKFGLVQEPNTHAYTILSQRTYFLSGISTNQSTRTPNILHLKKRFPINKTITYRTGTSNPDQQHLILIHCINTNLHTDTNVISFSGQTRFVYKDF